MTFSQNRLQTKVSFPKANDEWHYWLENNLEQALTVRNYIENLPETAVTFKPRNINVQTTPQHVAKMLKLAGSWKAETVTNTVNKWVNPNADDAYQYSDVLVTCECGLPMLHLNLAKPPELSSQTEHTDCTKADVYEARAELLRNRAQIIREAYEYGHSVRDASSRLGFQDTTSFSGAAIAELGLDIETLSRESRRKVAKTAIVLSRDYNPDTIGELFGISGRAISKILKRETTANAMTLYQHRRTTA